MYCERGSLQRTNYFAANTTEAATPKDEGRRFSDVSFPRVASAKSRHRKGIFGY